MNVMLALTRGFDGFNASYFEMISTAGGQVVPG